MPTVVSSIISYDLPQIDGRRNIHEQHMDDEGKEYDFFYTADEDMDINARMLARIPSIEAGE